MSGGTKWEPAMRAALAEAVRAGERGDVPIGAVLLDPSGRIIAAAGNERELTGDPTAHAEVLVLRRGARALGARRESEADTSGWRLEDCTLVVTLEPCTMCAGAIVNARVGRLVFGAFDAKAGAVSSIRDVVRDPRLNHRADVTWGVLAEECGEVLRRFFQARRDG